MPARRVVSRGTRRKLVWARSFGSNVNVPSVTGTHFNLLGTFETDYGANLIGSTVTRVRGLVLAKPTVTSSLGMVMGIRVGTEGDLGNTGPNDAQHADWMCFEPFLYNNGGLAGTADQSNGDALARVIDVKSQRKMEEVQDELSLWFQSTGPDFKVSWYLSVLLRLP